MVEPFVYRDPFPDEEVREVRRMKARIERERIPPGRGPAVPPEAGPGLAVGRGVDRAAPPADPRRGRPGAADDLDGRRAGPSRRPRGSRPADAEALRAAYRFCERARNLRYLLTGAPATRCPPTPPRPSASPACWATPPGR